MVMWLQSYGCASDRGTAANPLPSHLEVFHLCVTGSTGWSWTLPELWGHLFQASSLPLRECKLVVWANKVFRPPAGVSSSADVY